MVKTVIISFFVSVFLVGCKKEFKPRLDRAQDALNKSNYVQAIDDINLALAAWEETDGNEIKGQAYEVLGKAHYALRKTGKATDAFEQAIKFSTSTFHAAKSLAYIHYQEGKPKEAIPLFEQALAIKKNDPDALVGLGNSYYALKKYKSAISIYNKILDTSPGVRTALESMALAKKKLPKKSKKRRRRR